MKSNRHGSIPTKIVVQYGFPTHFQGGILLPVYANLLPSTVMSVATDRPVIVQSDRSILLETDGPMFEEARDRIAAFAELVKSPEHIHTYRITPLSLWNAASVGMTAEEIVANLFEFSKYEVPQNVIAEIEDNVARYGRLKLYKLEDGGDLVLESDDTLLIRELLHQKP